MSEKFSNYELGGKIGQGGMGEVFLARDPRLARDVALKILPDAFAADPERLARFEREARLLASLSHTNIASIYGLEQDAGRRALVLEYVAGDDLSTVIARGPVPVDDALDIARQIADALDSAHEQGIIHRDLKPANVKVMPDGTVKVLDFGLAKALDTPLDGETTDQGITQSPTIMGTAQGVILGTAAYMSPEQARGKTVDKRADIWAFGCVLFEMLTGRSTFTGETVSDTLAAILRAEPEWDTLPADTPDAVVAIMRRCLEKDPRRRLRDIGEARITIDSIQSGIDTAAIRIGASPASDSAVSSSPGAPAPARDSGRTARGGSGRTLWAFTILFAAAAIAFMALYLVERRQTEPVSVIRALITPEEGKAFNNSSFGAHAFHALSPDGKNVTFISDNYLWVRSLGQVNATQLPGTESSNFPFWSADGRSIGFFADGKLKTIPAAGGPVTVVCDAPGARGGTWNQDDVIVFTPRLRTGLYRVPAAGGTPEPLTTVTRPTHSTHRWPRFLPDGDHILYMAANHTNPKGAQTAIYATTLSGGVDRLLVPSDSNPVYASGYLLYTRDRNLMARPFDPATAALTGDPVRITENCAHHGGSWVGVYDARGDVLTYQGDAPPIGSELTWMDLDGNALGTIGGRDLHWDVDVSRDGRRLAIARGNPEPSVYIYDVERDIESGLTVDGSFSRAPVWSPNGTRIAYASIRDNGRLNVYVAPADRSSQPQPLIVEDTDMIPTSWSPDGRWLLVDHGDPGETEIWVIDMNEEPEATPVVQTRPWVYNGVFSPDGEYVAYVSREGGEDEVFVMPFPGPGGKTKLSGGLTASPGWGPDRKLFFATANNVVMESTMRLTENGISFSPARSLFRVQDDNSFFVQSGTVLTPSPDGRLLCFLAADAPADITALTLVVGWASELNRR